ncbi:GP16 [Parapoynx stagnalis nucleopolyhedrovirus]|uniref:GP16 n=1 Tax=Parapoynx stagnalis nucleopolyhedrovirus TaxID=2993413 RepID=A0A9E7YF23_9ABAC|nr:GP16 [Parapoynx stagnalis nucleopolyhedrovirus]
MNFWALFSIVLIGYVMYSGHLNDELQEIKSILIVIYETVEKRFTEVIGEIDSLKTDTLKMLNNLQNNTIRTWDAVVKNGKKITNLDDKINALLVKNGVVNNA